MAKQFKLRISRVITSFQSCRSKDDCNLPEEPIPYLLRPSPGHPKPTDVESPATPPPFKPHRSSFKRHVSSAFSSAGCGFRSKYGTACSEADEDSDSPEFRWRKEEKWHVVAKVHADTPRRKIYNSSVSEDDAGLAPPPPSPPLAAQKKKRRSKKKKRSGRLRISTSSADSGLFSSEGGGDELDGGETETLVSSSRSFSTDSSSEFNPQLETIREMTPVSRRQRMRRKKNKKMKRAKRSISNVKAMCRSSPESKSPARLSMFKKLIPCRVEGKVRESYAVVKKSEDPYEDFKRSMMEMILEKQMFEERELEQLLQCFLSLNSRHHHDAIVEAFSEIWDAMFCRTSTHQRVSNHL